jgi:hypothetical protein
MKTIIRWISNFVGGYILALGFGEIMFSIVGMMKHINKK